MAEPHEWPTLQAREVISRDMISDAGDDIDDDIELRHYARRIS